MKTRRAVFAGSWYPAGASDCENEIRTFSSDTKFHVTVSIGVATVPPGVVASPEAVVSVADKNLYEAKASGRNRSVASSL